jgi:amino acid adenylation domain-containing protein
VEDKLLELKPYERLPLFDIVRAIGENTQDRNPIFDTIFNFVDFHVLGQIQQDYGKDESGKLNVEGNIITNTLFNFNVSTTLEDFGVFISYSESLLSEEAVEKLCRYFKGVLNKFIDEPRGMANKLELIPLEERKKLLEEFNDTNTEYPVNKTIHELFAAQVERMPDRIALVGQGAFLKNRPLVDPQKTFNYLSYRQLHEQSNQLACLLIEKGVLADNIVGIMMERSIEMMVGIYGILKSGGAYLPIDPSYPQERIDYMLKDSGARLLVSTNDKEGEKVRRWEGEKVLLKEIPKSSYHLTFLPSYLLNSSHLAYIIYTSGSTGRPKGVMIEHRSVVNLLFALQNEYPFSSADTCLLKTSYIFDVSVTELFGWVVGGGRLAILEKGGEKDPEVIFDYVEGCQVTHINFVPSMFNEFIEHAALENRNRLSSLKYIFLAGEVLLPEAVKRFRALDIPAQLENIYGPTESTVYASKYSLSGWDGIGSIPIGKPLPNISLSIINKGGQWQSLGAVGELCIAGVGLARGYLNRPELTSERFYRSYKSYRTYIFYKTGDLARWLSDGNIEFLGRIDHQVKIRGYRIELDEIENHLSKYNGIKESVVVVNETENGDKNLAAYIVSDIEVSTEALRDYLANLLPGYMIPAYFVPLEKMPLTPSGKIDRSALPEPELMMGKEYEGPRNEIEKKLAELWAEILARNPLHMSQLQTSIGINDNFFQLGGHSLKATSLVSRIYKVFGVKIPLGEIFKRPTIKGLFDYLERAEREQYIWIEPTETKEYYELSPAQKSLFTLQQLRQGNSFYNMPSIIRLEHDLDKEKLQQVFQQIIKRHESLRTSFEIVNEIPVQRIHKELLFEFEHIELAKDRVGDRSAIENIIGSVILPFDLSRPPLFRVCLITAADLRLLVVDMHHIISDGISNMVLEKEFQVLCDGKELPPLRLQYKDYVGWRNGKAWQLKLRQQEMYWLSEFSPEPPALNLPSDYPRPVEKTFEGNTAGIALLAQEFLLLKEIARETGATMFVVVLWLFAILLSRLSGQEDIVIGVPVSGRPHSDLECLIGVFINTIPIRLSIDDTQPVRELLAHVKQKCLRAFENQDYPFEELVEKVAPERDINRNPLFDVLLNYMNHTETLASVWDHFSKEQYTYQGGSSKFDFSVDVHQYRDSMYLRFEYSTQLFKAETIDRFLECFRQIILSISNNREIKLEEIEISHDFGELETNVFSAAPVDFNSMFSRETEKINNNRSLK